MHIDQTTLDFISAHRHDDVRRLALQAARWPGVDIPVALQQIAGRQAAVAKQLPGGWTDDGIIYPPRLAMEQCSSVRTAEYKAMLARYYTDGIDDVAFVDLTGGLGVDFSCMAPQVYYSRVTYVERDEYLCGLARHNFPLLGLDRAEVVCADAVDHLRQMKPVDVVYLDPARRDSAGNRVYALSDCSPDVAALAPLLLQKAATVIIKLSPMLDMHEALRQLPCVDMVSILAVGGECKEMVVVMRRDRHEDGVMGVHCMNFHPRGHDRFTYNQGEPCPPAAEWDEKIIPLYLFEPNATIMKAGCFDQLAHRVGLTLMSRDSHLMVANHSISSQFGRVFSIEDISTMNKQELKALMRGVKKANVAVRNFPLRAPELAQRLKVKDGGDTYIFGTTTASGKHIIIKASLIKREL